MIADEWKMIFEEDFIDRYAVMIERSGYSEEDINGLFSFINSKLDEIYIKSRQDTLKEVRMWLVNKHEKGYIDFPLATLEEFNKELEAR